ncbi:nuclear factor 7, ovary-like [Trichomycterus rosablanca]|uniref:nuclear factor 7, ovary-like n=1 Tax=Trichomycterus rosablanca TaxID=2290929 RepID=UPI002F3523B0
MASSSSFLSEDQLQCSICLDVFTDPVTTPCGHNFCKTCIKECWDTSLHYQCPVCMTSFSKEPELCVNTFISGLVAPFRKSVQETFSSTPEKARRFLVLCDICCEKKREALKSCLICIASYCKNHLEPHQRVSSFKSHKLIDAVENLKDYICQKHEKHLEMFCRDDQMCVCQFCTEAEHKNHNTVSIEKESGMKKRKKNKRKMAENGESSVYTLDVILDPDTANSELILSDDGKQVSDGDTKQDLPDNKERFDTCVCVLGKEGFSSGRFYYEVQVKGKTEWELGVTRESSNRKGIISAGPENGEWSVCLRNETEYKALDSSSVLLSLKQAPQKVGVFVDYGEGLVSFYDVENESHIYSYTEKHREGESMEIFRALIRSIERNQAEMLKVMEEKQRAEEREAEEFIKDLEQEITELNRRKTELEQISNTEDHLHLLQIYSSLCRPPPTNNWTDVSIQPHLGLETLRRALSQLQECVDKEMSKIVRIELKRIQQYAVDVHLDPDTANSYLILSDDGKQVTCGDKRQKLPDNPERFNPCVCVLGKEGFSSGRFYYEVQVEGKTEWDLGVTRKSSKRKGKITVSPDDGYWSVWLRNKTEYKALDSPRVHLFLKQAPQKVGVFVDYEEGLVSFYDVENESHIYSFTGQSFTEKLYPYFCPCYNDEGENSVPLIICPVSQVQSLIYVLFFVFLILLMDSCVFLSHSF